MNAFFGELPKNQIIEFSPGVWTFAGSVDVRLATVRNKRVITVRDVYEYSQLTRYSPECKEFTRRVFKSKRDAQKALAALSSNCRECGKHGTYNDHLCESCFFDPIPGSIVQ